MLKEEYFKLIDIIYDFDKKSLYIKSIGTPICATPIGVAFMESQVGLFILSAFIAVAFWLIEAYWKAFQYMHYDRLDKIEKFFSGSRDISPLQISTSWYNNWKAKNDRIFKRSLMRKHVCLPYLVIILFNIIMILVYTF